ncbi:hypothetical protein NPIL_76741 [Nephila pilipes]|uniref:Uncharacterized protein n=1 Tax=Nephila pilipes TaxID=299642 RepID=A0A8X6I500_NEPPI|nr:hypothetical protein NPIL_76741 [Nephila pilipes]
MADYTNTKFWNMHMTYGCAKCNARPAQQLNVQRYSMKCTCHKLSEHLCITALTFETSQRSQVAKRGSAIFISLHHHLSCVDYIIWSQQVTGV